MEPSLKLGLIVLYFKILIRYSLERVSDDDWGEIFVALLLKRGHVETKLWLRSHIGWPSRAQRPLVVVQRQLLEGDH